MIPRKDQHRNPSEKPGKPFPWESTKRTLSGYPYLESYSDGIDHTIGPDISQDFLLCNLLIPLLRDPDGAVAVAVADPHNTIPIDLLAGFLAEPLTVCVMAEESIRRFILQRAAFYRKSSSEVLAESPSREEQTITGSRHPAELLVSADAESQVIQLVNSILTEAIESEASDIHIEPEREGVRVRYRIDGLLQDALQPPEQLKETMISRIKIMAGMDISKRHVPQDGNLAITVGGRPKDIRISAVPTPFGERLVLRILGREGHEVTLDRLGMPESLIQSVEIILTQTNGLLIVAGPTGSGKTTTLYACLNRIDTATRNVMTIEDPVEYEIPGISQIQIGGKETIDFADGLRSMLRQDPDIMMVGEIRDRDTASIALRSALTGHFILTTIHTGSIDGAVIRLLDLEAGQALIAETVSGILEQRLIRLRCPACQTDQSDRGCPVCRFTGYKGRTALYQFVRIDSELRMLIRRGDHSQLKTAFQNRCNPDFRTQADALIQAGKTTVEEADRVLGERKTGGENS
jgi:general secretion pathway protein E